MIDEDTEEFKIDYKKKLKEDFSKDKIIYLMAQWGGFTIISSFMFSFLYCVMWILCTFLPLQK